MWQRELRRAGSSSWSACVSATSKHSLDDLLAPVSRLSPAGEDLRHSHLYDRIRTARRSADDKRIGRSAQEDRVGPGPEQEWRAIAEWTRDAIASQSKDLQLAVWLLDARAHLDGFEGVASGVELIREMLIRFWET